ncbi:iron transporter [Intrasporangium sp. DVR]|uniref:iron transporter n=1 Tax=Intrasporangium sp. DVR TaxID=3127867 RepID=UPI00313A5D3D
MRRATLTALTAPLAIAALTACSTEEGAHDDKEFAVPAGVQKQYAVLAAELAEKGKTVESGEWTVNLITEAAEPWFEAHGAHGAQFRAPKAGETHHIEIIPTETSTGRIVPDVPITLEVVNAEAEVVQKLKLNFYYSTFYHYANNFTVPDAGTYTLRATLGVPAFNRHGEQSETPPLTEGTTVEFADVELTK